jgi:alpha-glucosidase (family GH31 glycosyl hydrolase)
VRLRVALGPYLYTLARDVYDTGLPITGALYLRWPGLAAAYQHPSEYTFGSTMVVQPVTADGDPAPATIWVPPGAWIDYFTGARFQGPRTVTLSVPLSQMPVLVRAGSIVPTQHDVPYTPEGPPRTVVLTVYEGARGSFRLYDDQGAGFGYQRGAFTWTPIVYRRDGHRAMVTIGPARGRFPGAPARRSWVVRFVGTGGRGTQTVTTGPEPTDRRTTVTAR